MKIFPNEPKNAYNQDLSKHLPDWGHHIRADYLPDQAKGMLLEWMKVEKANQRVIAFIPRMSKDRIAVMQKLAVTEWITAHQTPEDSRCYWIQFTEKSRKL